MVLKPFSHFEMLLVCLCPKPFWSIVVRVIALFFAILLMSGCFERMALCQDAVKKHLEGMKPYKITRFYEEEAEGRGISSFLIEYRYRIHRREYASGSLVCIYEDSGQTVSVYDPNRPSTF